MAKKECKIIKYSEMLEYVINELVQYTLEYDFWKEIKGDALVDEIIESTWFDVEEFEEHPLWILYFSRSNAICRIIASMLYYRIFIGGGIWKT